MFRSTRAEIWTPGTRARCDEVIFSLVAITDDGWVVHMVSFDVAVTVQEASGAGGGIKILGLGIEGN